MNIFDTLMEKDYLLNIFCIFFFRKFYDAKLFILVE